MNQLLSGILDAHVAWIVGEIMEGVLEVKVRRP